MTADEAERHAIPFGLTYLSRDGYAKLAMLIAHLLEQQRKEMEAEQR